MDKLKIEYVQRRPRGSEDLPPAVVELWIGVSGRKVDVNIVRRGFILAVPVMHMLKERIKRLALATAGINKPLVERIGLSPQLSPDWRHFFDKVLKKRRLLVVSRQFSWGRETKLTAQNQPPASKSFPLSTLCDLHHGS
jgi:hypothetical protein